MTVKAVYPNGIVPWTNRVDRLNTVYALDPNTLAAELVAVQSTLGTNPQIEASTPVGSKVTYPNVNARIHDVMTGHHLPVVSLKTGQITVLNDGQTHRAGYGSVYDPEPIRAFNGIDINVNASGWWVVTASASFPWQSSGWYMMQLSVAGNIVDEDWWSWDFSENKPGGNWHNAPKLLSCFYQGAIQNKQRISVFIRNSSSASEIQLNNALLKASYHRDVPVNVSG